MVVGGGRLKVWLKLSLAKPKQQNEQTVIPFRQSNLFPVDLTQWTVFIYYKQTYAYATRRVCATVMIFYQLYRSIVHSLDIPQYVALRKFLICNSRLQMFPLDRMCRLDTHKMSIILEWKALPGEL